MADCGACGWFMFHCVYCVSMSRLGMLCVNSVDVICSWFMYSCFGLWFALDCCVLFVCLVTLRYIVVSWWLGLFSGLRGLVIRLLGLCGFAVACELICAGLCLIWLLVCGWLIVCGFDCGVFGGEVIWRTLAVLVVRVDCMVGVVVGWAC